MLKLVPKHGKRQYCSRKCGEADGSPSKGQQYLELVCQTCNRIFRSVRPDREYCSRECATASHQGTTYPLTCTQCFKSFQSSGPKRKFCSDACRAACRRDNRVIGHHGLTGSDAERVRGDMADLQGGRCVICQVELSKEKRVMLDHDHGTGFLRGVLCHNCNMGLGHFKDSPQILRSAIVYLEENSVFTAEDLGDW